jgi:hypothetical protein
VLPSATSQDLEPNFLDENTLNKEMVDGFCFL